jgi:hypothetical protein
MTIEVSLRKAAKLSQGLLDAARAVSLRASVNVSIYNDVNALDAIIAREGAALDASVARATALVRSGYAIRASIRQSNEAAGVNALLDEKAALEAEEKLLAALPTQSAGPDLVAEKRRLAALQERAKTDYVTENVPVSVLQDEMLDGVVLRRAAIARRKSEIQDALLNLNLTNKVTLSDETATLLADERLI